MLPDTEERLRRRDWLDDEAINMLLALLIGRGEEEEGRVCFVTSLVIQRYYEEKREKHLLAYGEKFRRPSRACRLILMPIWRSDHWSLLVRCYTVRRWLHFDSIPGYHRRHVERLLATRLQPFYAKDESDLPPFALLDFPWAPRQHAGWECGLFLLMNAWLMIHYAGRAGPLPRLSQHLAQYQQSSICEEKLPLFTRNLLTLFPPVTRKRKRLLGDEDEDG